jgi:hypothetical protein
LPQYGWRIPMFLSSWKKIGRQYMQPWHRLNNR